MQISSHCLKHDEITFKYIGPHEFCGFVYMYCYLLSHPISAPKSLLARVRKQNDLNGLGNYGSFAPLLCTYMARRLLHYTKCAL